MMIRCGDTVRYQPSGERMKVAWAEGDLLGPSGWGMSAVSLADCSAVERCSDAEHAAAVRRWFEMSGKESCHRPRMERLYGRRKA